MPVSRIIMLADGVVKVTSRMVGPKRPSRMATMSGPPARPSLSGTGRPGTANGTLPTMTPSRSPMKIVMMFGWSSFFTWLPSLASMRATAVSGPTQ